MHERDEAQHIDRDEPSFRTWHFTFTFECDDPELAARVALGAADAILSHDHEDLGNTICSECTTFALENPDRDPVHIAWDDLTPDSVTPDRAEKRDAA